MKIAHINLARGYRGGERQTQLLIESLCGVGSIEQQFVGARKGVLVDKLPLPPTSSSRVGRPYLLNASAVKGADLLHVHEGKAGHFALMAHLRYGIPYIITRRVPNSPKNNFFTHRVYQQATRIVAISNAIKSYMHEYDADLAIDVIPSMMSGLGIDEQNVAHLREQFKGKFIVGHIGALVNHHKGQQYIIEAAKRLQTSHPDIHFLLLGSGKDERMLKEMATGLSNVTFTGFVDCVGDYLDLFDIFVFPSLEEGLGSILLDVMNASCPIIASNVDGIPDLIRAEDTGILIPPKDSEALGMRILDLYRSEALRDSLAKNAYLFAQSYSPAQLSLRYLGLYKEILDR